ncbi:MAG: 4Fe-4S dicluster domain-containing protein [Desulfobacteraceae bacterium]|nr:MAG: 4Fe-4S dicluster domain-containing protein [Desulfobacteraceae bacterium]
MKEIPLGKELYGMVIDLDRCTGCGACGVACSAENNIAYRTDETDKLRTGTWMRLYRLNNGKPFPKTRVAYFPRPCMHCQHHTPCVSVCPVNATKIDEKGVVSQIYPRCIGCRYCVAACPYHARLFHWWDPVFPKGLENYLSPDVSVAMRGVVHKCTFCHHRYQRAKDRAFMEERRDLKEGEYTTACAEACPTKAITFGNLQNPESSVAKLSKSPQAFRLLEKLGTQPKVYYLTSQEWIQRQIDNYLEGETIKRVSSGHK